MNYTIRHEQPKDYKEVENLTRESFWNVYRPGCLEHYVLHLYRDKPDFIPELDYVLEVDGKIIGHVMYAHSHIDCKDGTKLPIMTFGPISIAPGYKLKGWGTILLNYSMGKALEMGCGALAICGKFGFYGKCGFEVAKNRGILYEDDPTADYFLIKELKPNFLNGVEGTYKDPDGYFVNPDAAEAFDKQFPPKEKQVLPGQL